MAHTPQPPQKNVKLKVQIASHNPASSRECVCGWNGYASECGRGLNAADGRQLAIKGRYQVHRLHCASPPQKQFSDARNSPLSRCGSANTDTDIWLIEFLWSRLIK